ncbi:hypothetical protein KM043_009153 [Ampulex compressa]|nr:hypothetical protein KM043_009153 [Ampulex compressa]
MPRSFQAWLTDIPWLKRERGRQAEKYPAGGSFEFFDGWRHVRSTPILCCQELSVREARQEDSTASWPAAGKEHQQPRGASALVQKFPFCLATKLLAPKRRHVYLRTFQVRLNKRNH